MDNGQTLEDDGACSSPRGTIALFCVLVGGNPVPDFQLQSDEIFLTSHIPTSFFLFKNSQSGREKTSITPQAIILLPSRTLIVYSITTTTTTTTTLHYYYTTTTLYYMNNMSNTTLQPQEQEVCLVCGVGDDGRRLCHFIPNEDCPDEILLHVFCGKTAAILPHVNRPDLEILTKAGVKNKHGTGVSVTLALQRCRSARVNDPSNREQEYYLSKEFERIYLAVTKEPAHQEDLEDEHHHHHHHLNHHHHHHHLHNNNNGTGAGGYNQGGGGDVTSSSLQPQTVPNPMYTDYPADAVEASSVSPENLDYLHHSPAAAAAAAVASTTTTTSASTDEPASKRHKSEQQVQQQQLPKSPYDIEMENLQQICDRCSGVGYSLIRGVAREQSAGTTENEEDDFDPTNCSQEQVNHVRVVVITKERQDRMEEMNKLVLGEQHGQELMTFNTSFSYQVINAWNAFTVRFHEASTTSTSSNDNNNNWQEKFDLLLGFTDTLKEHDVWMHDHEDGWGGEKMVEQLAKSWQLVLERTNEELGVDPEYTRPGVVALLEQFKEAVESVEPQNSNEAMHFDFTNMILL